MKRNSKYQSARTRRRIERLWAHVSLLLGSTEHVRSGCDFHSGCKGPVGGGAGASLRVEQPGGPDSSAPGRALGTCARPGAACQPPAGRLQPAAKSGRAAGDSWTAVCHYRGFSGSDWRVRGIVEAEEQRGEHSPRRGAHLGPAALLRISGPALAGCRGQLCIFFLVEFKAHCSVLTRTSQDLRIPAWWKLESWTQWPSSGTESCVYWAAPPGGSF